MEANDAADHIVDAVDETRDKFRPRVALAIGVMAMLLAITSLGGGNAAEDMLGNNIHASDTWAFYQAKNVRQTIYKIAAEEIESDLKTRQDSLSAEGRAALQRRLEEYNQTVARYESERDPQDPQNPLKGEGKRELSALAQNYEKQRDVAIRKDPNFDFAEALFQIAIVLGSVGILATSRKIVVLSLGMAVVATTLMANGFFLFFSLPF